MAVVFKSNIRATAVIRNLSGYQGPSDFTANADFSNSKYQKALGMDASINDILITQGQASFLKLDNEWGDVSFSQSNMPRLTYLVEHNTVGLSCSEGNTNHYWENRDLIVLPETNIRAYALYACKGSATLKDLNKVTVNKGDGTLQNPLIFYYKDTVNLEVIKSIDCKDIVCVALVSGRVPYVPFGVPGTNADVRKNINMGLLNSSEFTIVMRVIEPTRGVDVAMTGIATYIKAIQDDKNSFTVAKSRNSDLRTNFLKNGAAVADWQAADVNKTIDTLVIRLKDGVVTRCLNGVILPQTVNKMDVNFKVNSIYLMAGDEQWGSTTPESALLNLVTYDRALTNEEIANAQFK